MILVARKSIFSLAIGFTSPRSPSQHLAFALFICCTWLGVYAFSGYVQSTSLLSGIAIGDMLGPPLGFFDDLKMNVEGPARFITYDVLHIPRGTVTARYVFLFSVFFVSGCIHIGSNFGLGVMPSQSRALRFSMTQAFAIVLEDVV